MSSSDTVICGTEFGVYLWSILICVNKEVGFGSFSTLMPYPPVEGRSIEFYNTPEGDFLGTIIDVHEAVRFAPCEVIQPNKDFGMPKKITVKPSIIQFQVRVDVTNSSQLGSFGIPEL
ncbi:hypothetical protein Osc7112_1929 [Oscillatoria nigro-viridis PCC 7112]|uniref:Uncharacterized protein n=1 Tax=Phormidium nigroviride PCC 7112 TaxID=179408 RepID=K9VFW8_9CYAN|nr:hypothetical protein [Oscillatoria nigro-viridis]AFZ06409.1 hypothetical protein Osc7112_1929 [Oscillatoria nigro-viridis PCC 7112]